MAKGRNIKRRVIIGAGIAIFISLALLSLQNVRAFAAIGLGCTFGLVYALVTDGR